MAEEEPAVKVMLLAQWQTRVYTLISQALFSNASVQQAAV